MRAFFRFLSVSLAAFALSLSSLSAAKDVYVSPAGSDDAVGSFEAPFQTIANAVSQMDEGDVCWLMEGVYREPIVPGADDLTFRAYPNNAVTLSAFEPLSGWSAHEGSTYVADLAWSLGEENQVFFNQKMMQLARWPNKTNDDLFDLEMVWATGTNSSVSHESIPDQNWADGGVILFLGKNRWTSWRVPVTGSQSGKVDFAELPDDWDFAGSHSPMDRGEFYLMNTYEALDAEGEWYVDEDSDKLYFKAPGGGNPDTGEVLVRRRTVLADLRGRNGIVLKNIEFFGGAIDLGNAEECEVRSCRIYYGSHTLGVNRAAVIPHASIKMDSNSVGNVVYRNDIQWGAGSGVIVRGQGNLVDNNYIGNFDYLGCYSSPVEMRDTNFIMRNEIFNAGRDCVRGGGTDLELGYNNIHHANLINDDCGGVYMCCGTYRGTRIHHNWIHDIESRNNNYESYKATGVYLDNSTVGVTVDHNVFWNLEWSNIQINWEGRDLELHNNTIWANEGPNSRAMARWVNGYEFFNVNLFNTLSNHDEFHANSVENSCVVDLDADPFEDFEAQVFVPKEGSCAVDGGRVIPGITEEYVGAAPDIGAYERGGYVWVPGPDWELGESMFDEDVPDVEYRFDGRDRTGDFLFSDLTPGRAHQLLGSTDLVNWERMETFLAPVTESFELQNLALSGFRFFRLVERLAIPQEVAFVSATLAKDKGSIRLKFDGELTEPLEELSGMAVSLGGNAVSLAGLEADVEDGSVWKLRLANPAADGQSLVFSYTPVSVIGVSGGEVSGVSDEPVDGSVSDANLVAGKNGDGEKGDASGWELQRDDNGTTLPAKVSSVQDPVHGGQYAIQAVYDDDAGDKLVNLRHKGGRFEVKAGGTYQFSIWHYGKDLDGIDSYTTEMSIYNADTGEVMMDYRTWKSGTPNQWNQTTREITFKASEGGEYVLGFRIYSGHFTLIVDDVSVVRVE
ncbi:right-handed parallel beta-helix repeat-containing protein [Pelagicoccus mobilis]|uniref:Right-handed parallel beta-helix repeat-containing protein n=1 Tax=Pelagicoccus mobilis TaxID=415221 RepID=A0A934VSG5_9BACT|nr:right-handed parallel beta-helix repeat-containing protein [Pelagicoccus mobilis]MBK1880402.1 right-handed parallel beta-helix repeat-containing protein [Pelagicoccus mobilis]